MGLPWVRVDANIAHHDKIVYLQTQRGGWRAIAVYIYALGWAAGQGTDGYIPQHMATPLSADKQTINLLTAAHMWEPVTGGWQIRNYAQRQELEVISEGKRAAQRLGAAKGNCIRYHGPDCGCWRTAANA